MCLAIYDILSVYITSHPNLHTNIPSFSLTFLLFLLAKFSVCCYANLLKQILSALYKVFREPKLVKNRWMLSREANHHRTKRHDVFINIQHRNMIYYRMIIYKKNTIYKVPTYYFIDVLQGVRFMCPKVMSLLCKDLWW